MPPLQAGAEAVEPTRLAAEKYEEAYRLQQVGVLPELPMLRSWRGDLLFCMHTFDLWPPLPASFVLMQRAEELEERARQAQAQVLEVVQQAVGPEQVRWVGAVGGHLGG
jgi:hypothetical protein